MGVKSLHYQHRGSKFPRGQCGIQDVTPKAYCPQPLSHYYYSGGSEPSAEDIMESRTSQEEGTKNRRMGLGHRNV